MKLDRLLVFTIITILLLGMSACADIITGENLGFHPIIGKWTAANGTWVMNAWEQGGDHERTFTSAGGVALFGKSKWQDYRVSVRLVKGSDVANIILRSKGSGTGNCVQFGRYGNLAVLLVFSDGVYRKIASVDAGPIHLPESLAAEIIGNTFRGYIAGKLVVEHTFQPGEIPDSGKAGLQTNHPSATFDNLQAEVFKSDNAAGVNRHIEIESIQLSENTCGARKLIVKIKSDAGVNDIAAVYCEASAIVPGLTNPASKRSMQVPVGPLEFIQKTSETESIWQGTYFTLFEGLHHLNISVLDGDDIAHGQSVDVRIKAKMGTYTTFGKRKVFESIDPHPVWRPNVLEVDPGKATRYFTNYIWRVAWGPEEVFCQPQIAELERDNKTYVGRKIIIDDHGVSIRPILRLADGSELTGMTTRRLGSVTSMFGVQPTYETVTPVGRLVWWIKVFPGDPILRIRGVFYATSDLQVVCEYQVKHTYGNASVIGNGLNYAAWRSLDGPVIVYASNRKSMSGFTSPDVVFGKVTVRNGEKYEIPMFAVAVVDAGATPDTTAKVRVLSAKLAKAALAEPGMDGCIVDTGRVGNTQKMVLKRSYKFLSNDWNMKDDGQFVALPWCVGSNVDKSLRSKIGYMHTAYGERPYVIAKSDRVSLELPLPDLSWSTLTPDYSPLTGDWLKRAVECIDYIATQQNPDGTFKGYERMDHYSLARMTLGLMVSYKGLAGAPQTQIKISKMVKKSLARMMGEQEVVVADTVGFQKTYEGGAEAVAWKQGTAYEPFVYSTRWNVYTEMGSFVDQNLGHAHLLYTLLLYGRYIDPGYLKKSNTRSHLEELIKFQWCSQDWNGDIWRVYAGGTAAAGSGDGYEEDLAMVLPRLAEMAGLDTQWKNLAGRISSMKFGALRHFDYLPVKNEWGYDFLTPIHLTTQWMPESGWNKDYVGDVWYSAPAVGGGIYGPWYVDNVYKGLSDVFNQMWYRLMEEPVDSIARDGRHWLTIGGYCSEARMYDPFLGAVKLLRAYDVAKARDYLTPKTQGEIIWNFAFYPAAMTMINHELQAKCPFMRKAVSVASGASCDSPDQAGVYSWKIPKGAIVSVAAYRLKIPARIAIQLNATKLGLNSSMLKLTDIKTGKTRVECADSPIKVLLNPRSAVTMRVESM